MAWAGVHREAGVAFVIQRSKSDDPLDVSGAVRRHIGAEGATDDDGGAVVAPGPRRAAYLRLARLAAAVLGAPAGAVTLVDQAGALVLGREGPDLGMLPFCRLVAGRRQPLLVRDSRHAFDHVDADLRDAGLRDAADHPVRAYAGVPILTADGHCLGALCAGAPEPREWGEDDLALLRDLAMAAATEMERVRIEERLDVAWAHYAALLENVPDIAWTKDAALRYTAGNSAMALDMGMPLDRIVGATAADLFPPEVARILEANDRYVLETGRPLSVEERVPRPGGGERTVDTVKAPLRDASGAVIGLVGIARDLSARREAEETLRRSESRYRSLFEDVPVGLYRTRPDGEILAVNQALAEMLGYDTPAALEGGHFAHDFYVDPADREAWREIVHREGQVRGFEMRHRTVDGRQIWVRFNSRVERAEDGRILYYEGAIEDITQRREAEEARRDAEARARNAASTLRMTLEAAPVGIALLDSDGRVEAWNAAAGRMLARREAEVVGAPFPGVAPDRFAAFQERLRRVVAHGEVVSMESVLESDAGELLHAWITLGPLPPDEAGQHRVVAIVADVTEQKELEEQLRQAQKMEAVGRLAGGIAHDFNNVLTAIGGHVQLLLDDMAPDHPHHSDLREVLQGALRAGALTRQLLAFSRQQVLRPEVVDLGRVLRRLEPMLRRLIREDIELVVDAVDGCRVRIDPNQFEQIIMNLVVNARDAIPADGRITVTVARVEVGEGGDQPIHVSYGDYIRLAVADTGTGMEAGTLSRIFEPFFTTKEAGKGTGLGLSTVYGTVKQSGGFIWADSELGAGTVFDILLPRSDEPDPEPAGGEEGAPGGGRASDRGPDPDETAPSSAEEPADAGAGRTVLLVEDEAAVRELARRVLERRGYRVICASDPGEALRAAADAGPIDALVSDVVMPVMSGRELARRLRELRPGLPTLLMSGYTADEAIRTDVGAVGAAFLEKPFTPRQLLAAVAGLLRVPAR